MTKLKVLFTDERSGLH